MNGAAGQGRTALPLVSVVTASYNRAGLLRECLASVEAQTYPRDRIESIVVDGGSTDGSVDWLRQRQAQGWTGRWTSERDGGPYDAMNKGIALARGEFIVFLNTDDAFEPEAIASAVDALEASGADYAYADAILVDHRSGQAVGSIPGDLANIYFHTPYCHQTLVCRRRCFEELGGFDLSLKIQADYDFMWRLAARGYRAVRLPRPTVRYRTGGLAATFTGEEALEVQRRNAAVYREAFERDGALPRHYLWKILSKLVIVQRFPDEKRQRYATKLQETLTSLGLDKPGLSHHFSWPRRSLYSLLINRYTRLIPPPCWILGIATWFFYYEWRLRVLFANSDRGAGQTRAISNKEKA